MGTLLRDLRYSLRLFKRRPAYALAAIVVLALGIGAGTAIFSVLYAVMWRDLPYKDADRLAIVWESKPDERQNVVSPANYADWREQSPAFQDMAAFADGVTNLTKSGDPEELAVQYVTPNFFSVLGVSPVAGATFAGQNPESDLIILSYGLWQRRFAGDPQIVGKKLLLNNREQMVVGVMPAEFRWFIKKGSFTRKTPDLWMQYPITQEERIRKGRYMAVVARLKDGVSIQQAQSSMDVIAKRLEQQYKDFNTGWGVNVVPLRNQLTGEVRTALFVLAGAVGFVLLIACTNVANLLLARALSATREIAVRSALGARPYQIIRQLMTESLFLAVMGGIVGLFIAFWGVQGLGHLGSQYGIDFREIHVNAPVLLFSLGASLLTGVLFGAVPAWEVSRWNVQQHLKETAKGSSSKGGRIRNVLIVAELALAMVLLAGAALLLQSFGHLMSVRPGFNADHVLTFRVLLPGRKFPEEAKRVAFIQQAVERLRAMPGVDSAGAVNFLPFTSSVSATNVQIEGRPPAEPGKDLVTEVFVTDQYFFKTMQIPLIRGRGFTTAEATESKKVVLINETFARQFFPNEDPIGKRVTINMKDDNQPTTIIGIVGDVKHSSLDATVSPAAFWPHPELPMGFMSFVVRLQGDPMEFVPSAREMIHSLDPDQPIADVKLMTEWVGTSTVHAKFNMILMAMLAIVALILAVVGIYGMMSYAVIQRVQEIGVRMALGANATDVVRLILRQAGLLVAVGTGFGLLASIGLTRLMKSLLFEVKATDATTFLLVTAVLASVALVACWIPARRAAMIDPLLALRAE